MGPTMYDVSGRGRGNRKDPMFPGLTDFRARAWMARRLSDAYRSRGVHDPPDVVDFNRRHRDVEDADRSDVAAAKSGRRSVTVRGGFQYRGGK